MRFGCKLQEDVKEKITNSLFKAFTEKYDDIDTVTGNYVPIIKWDKFNTYLVNSLNTSDQIITKIISRKIWELVMIYVPESKHAIFVLRDSRFDELGKEKLTHYIRVLLRHNEKYNKFASYEQTDFFDIMPEPISNEILNELEQSILEELSGQVESVGLVMFDAKKYELKNVDYVIPGSNLSIVESQNWNDYIPSVYDEEHVNDEVEEYNEQVAMMAKKPQVTLKISK